MSMWGDLFRNVREALGMEPRQANPAVSTELEANMQEALVEDDAADPTLFTE